MPLTSEVLYFTCDATQTLCTSDKPCQLLRLTRPVSLTKLHQLLLVAFDDAERF